MHTQRQKYCVTFHVATSALWPPRVLMSPRFLDSKHLLRTYCVPGTVLGNRDQQGTKRCCVRDNVRCSPVKNKMKKNKAGEDSRKG